MSMVSFTEFINDLAEELIVINKSHSDFIIATCSICEAIQDQMAGDGAVFKNCLDHLHTTASYVNNLVLDMPLNFQVFLPIRLPVPTTCSFDEERRTVQVTRCRTEHPFFFGDAVNFKRMNVLLHRELSEAVKNLHTIETCGVVYELSYSARYHSTVPFQHTLVAMEKGSSGERCIRFDFVLALSFDGATDPLPPYYGAPIVSQWLAYGMLEADGSPRDWAVLVPKWKSADTAVCLRSLSTIIMLHRLMKIQQCSLFANPFSLKFSFALVTEDRGESYQQMSIAEMTVTTLFYQVVRNIYQSATEHATLDTLQQSSQLAIQGQQVRARGLYNILAYGAAKNEIFSGYIFAFFTNFYSQTSKTSEGSQCSEAKEADSQTVADTSLESDSETPGQERRKSI